jgi:hypothetical protein
VSFAAMTLCVVSQQVFIVIVVCFFIDSVQKRLDTPSYMVKLACYEAPQYAVFFRIIIIIIIVVVVVVVVAAAAVIVHYILV